MYREGMADEIEAQRLATGEPVEPEDDLADLRRIGFDIRTVTTGA
jgi:hypothetical protein